MRDKIKDGFLYHPVKKIWNGIVSIGSYTLDKCLARKLGLVIFYDRPGGVREEMKIPFLELSSRSFQLHKKVIPSKFGRPYYMYDFGWKPLVEQPAPADNGKCFICGKDPCWC